MRILVAPDKYKGTLSARAVAESIASGIRKALPDAQIDICPAADGGDGTAETLADALGGRMVAATVTGPLGDPVRTRFAVIHKTTGVIEMASASGIALLGDRPLRPTEACTYGTGELIGAALEAGCTELIVGIGGSATTDGGAGMAAALGARLVDDKGDLLGPGGGELCRLAAIDISSMNPGAVAAQVMVACDVTSTLLGPGGAARTYAPQKGATLGEVEQLERCLWRYAEIVERDLGIDVRDIPGSGAAGGLGAGLVAFLDAELRPGVEIVLEALDFDRRLDGVDLVITGEGTIDAQSASGKTPVGVARAAKRRGLPVIAIAGQKGRGAETVMSEGIDEIFALAPGLCTIEQAMAEPARWLEVAGEKIGTSRAREGPSPRAESDHAGRRSAPR